jgi:ribosomal protein L37AE/L43A
MIPRPCPACKDTKTCYVAQGIFECLSCNHLWRGYKLKEEVIHEEGSEREEEEN